KAIGKKVIGNKSASGTEIIAELGNEHIKSGSPIVYTSADSVFQIASHVEIIPLNELYTICQIARNMLVGEHNIQRVIARPFTGEAGSFVRTTDRKDFSVSPPSKTLLDNITDNNGSVFAVGKIEDIFNSMGITEAVHTTSNKHGMQITIDAIKSSNYTLIFTNLVDFDTLYGHRNDAIGYAKSLEEFDMMLPELMDSMNNNDMLVITADHGCDPSTPGTDHTREYVPLLIYGKNINQNINLGIRSSFADLAKTLADILNIKNNLAGESFAEYIKS
ncbi:MAG: phosphopentomutase, partial [Armatimonadota bacterium]